MFDTAMSAELILKFVKDKQDTTQVGTKDIVAAAGTMIGAGLSVMPFLAGTGVAEIVGGLINSLIGVVGGTQPEEGVQQIECVISHISRHCIMKLRRLSLQRLLRSKCRDQWFDRKDS